MNWLTIECEQVATALGSYNVADGTFQPVGCPAVECSHMKSHVCESDDRNGQLFGDVVFNIQYKILIGPFLKIAF